MVWINSGSPICWGGAIMTIWEQHKFRNSDTCTCKGDCDETCLCECHRKPEVDADEWHEREREDKYEG